MGHIYSHRSAAAGGGSTRHAAAAKRGTQLHATSKHAPMPSLCSQRCLLPLLALGLQQLTPSLGAGPREFKPTGKSILLPNSRCTATPIGCFSDCLANEGEAQQRTLPISPGGCCGEPAGGCSTCATACIVESAKTKDFEKKICPKENKKGKTCPTCDPKTLTSAICADYCAEMSPEYKFAGVEFSTQCFCGLEVHERAEKDGTKADGTKATCDMPCEGNPSEMCGGNCAITMYQIDCGSNWGLPIILILLISAILYVGGGVTYNHKTKGTPLGKEALPNQEFWISLSALVVDGVIFTSAKSKAGLAMAIAKAKGEPYAPTDVENANSSDDKTVPLLGASEQKSEAGGHGGRSSGGGGASQPPRGPRAVPEQQEENAALSPSKPQPQQGSGSGSDNDDSDDIVE